MVHLKTISKTELQIMEVLWETKEPKTLAQLLTFFKEEKEKNWKTQTMATFLVRLSEKGLIKSKKQGRGKIYWAAITKEEFEQAKAKGILDVLYQGSIKNFLTALYGGKTVSTEEIEDLKKWLSEDRK